MPRKASTLERDAVVAASTVTGTVACGTAGAKLGAMVGTCGCPVVGTAIGAGLGGAIGALGGFATGRFMADQISDNDARKGRY